MHGLFLLCLSRPWLCSAHYNFEASTCEAVGEAVTSTLSSLFRTPFSSKFLKALSQSRSFVALHRLRDSLYLIFE